MGPPPPPIDPNLETFETSPTTHLALDQLVLTSPHTQQRPYYPKEISLTAGFFPEGQVTPMRPSQLDFNPSMNSHPDPWDPQRMNGRAIQPQLMNQDYTIAREQSRQNGQLEYWSPHATKSEMDSSTGRNVPDSGYYSQTQGTRSVFSNDLASNQDCQSVAGGITETEISRGEMQMNPMYPSEPSMHCQNGYPEEQTSEFPFELVCQFCQLQSRNRSEFL